MHPHDDRGPVLAVWHHEMNNSPDRRLHEAQSSTRCVVCGSPNCASVSNHGVFKAQLAQSLGEIEIGFDPIVINGRLIGHCLFAVWEEDGEEKGDACFIRAEDADGI